MVRFEYASTTQSSNKEINLNLFKLLLIITRSNFSYDIDGIMGASKSILLYYLFEASNYMFYIRIGHSWE